MGLRLLPACLLVTVALAVGCTGVGKKGSAEVPDPVGPVNTRGKPDPDKSHGELGLGGMPNLGGAPDVTNINAGGAPDPDRSHGTIGNVGPSNGGGRPDVSKSVPKKKKR